MNIAIIGSGGREHAICQKIKQSNRVKKIFCIPGNAGTSSIAENITKASNNTNRAGISLTTAPSNPDLTPLETTTAVIMQKIVCQAKSLSGSDTKSLNIDAAPTASILLITPKAVLVA